MALALGSADKVHKVSIIPRGMGALGYTIQRPTEDRYTLDEAEILNKIAVLLGGRAAEKLFCTQVSTGASDDLAKATDLARAMVTQFGMSPKIGLVNLERKNSAFLQSPYDLPSHAHSEEISGIIDLEVRDILQKSFLQATSCIEKNKNFVSEAFQVLLKTETLNELTITSLWKKLGNSQTNTSAI